MSCTTKLTVILEYNIRPFHQRSEYIYHNMRSADILYSESNIGVGAVNGRKGPRVAISVVISEDPGPPPSITSSTFLATGGGAVILFSTPTNQVRAYLRMSGVYVKLIEYVSSGWLDER